MTSCSEKIDVNSIDESKYQSSESTLAFISDKYGNSVADSLNFADQDSTKLYVELSQATIDNASFSLAYDAKALNDYNTTHGPFGVDDDFIAFPMHVAGKLFA